MTGSSDTLSYAIQVSDESNLMNASQLDIHMGPNKTKFHVEKDFEDSSKIASESLSLTSSISSQDQDLTSNDSFCKLVFFSHIFLSVYRIFVSDVYARLSLCFIFERFSICTYSLKWLFQ